MASGLSVSTECLEAFQELKLGKKLKYIIYGLSPTFQEVVVLKKSEASDWESFLADLPEDACRWAVYDYRYELEGGAGNRNKLAFIAWSPDDAKIKDKMVSASSREALKRTLVGIAAEIQATDYSEVAEESVLDRVRRSTR